LPVHLDESRVAQKTIANGELFGAQPKPIQESQPANPNAVLQIRQEQLKTLEIKPDTPLSSDLVRRQYHLLSEKLEGVSADWAVAARSALRSAAEALLAEWKETLDVPAPPATVPALRHNPDLDAMFGSH